MTFEQSEKNQDILNLQDLLIDEQIDDLSDYLSLSIENLGKDTKVSVTTVEENPVTYSSMLSGVSFTDLHDLAKGQLDIFNE